jgi:hypothetical protein
MCDLPECVHPGIGSPRADHLDISVCQVPEYALEFTLNGAQARLAGPAVELPAVVGQIKAEPQA